MGQCTNKHNALRARWWSLVIRILTKQANTIIRIRIGLWISMQNRPELSQRDGSIKLVAGNSKNCCFIGTTTNKSNNNILTIDPVNS